MRKWISLLGVACSLIALSAHALDPAGEGRRAYLKYNCSGCHGNRGGGGMGPAVAGEDDVDDILSGEDGGMRPYRGIVTSADLTNLRAYLLSIGKPNEPKFNHWWVPVPPR